MGEHLIFFDGECPFCHKSVRYILELDVHRRFLFAPLKGETAKEILIGPQAPLVKADSLVLVENFQSTERRFWVRARAVFRIHWLVGNGWGILGIFSFLPSWPFDALYRRFAAHRHRFKLKMPEAGPSDRFLP